ncbi:hypothetical protein APHAL10511_002290 [Amanita phalloides]|nr:hypothetical protein APHAL10511_002290 [Amanita phalloides]
MKVLSVAILFILVAVSLGQSVQIGVPKSGATIPAGRPFTVQIQKPDTITGSEELFLAISVASCPCGNPQDSFAGAILYNGTFNPQFHDGIPPPPFQDFYLTIPSDFPKGAAQINVLNLELVADAMYPMLQFLNTSITVA